MRPEIVNIPVPDTDATDGDEQTVFQLWDKSLQVYEDGGGALECDLELQATLDGNAWETVKQINGPLLSALPGTHKSFRVKRNTVASGTPRVVVAGFDARTDV